MKSKHIKNSVRIDILNTIRRLKEYSGMTLQKLLNLLGMSRSTYYRLSHFSFYRARRINVNKITAKEEAAVVEYALQNGNYNHRELAYRMLDEGVAYMSKTSVYRILKAHGLISRQKNIKTRKQQYYTPHKPPARPDELWQSDITYIPFKDRFYFLLIFIDVYSRYIPHYRLMTDMTSRSVSQEFQVAYQKGQLKRKPILQTDNGSSYTGKEFKTLLMEMNITHNRISPGCPNQNAEIERANRTLKELLLEYPYPKNFRELEKDIENLIEYYNEERYHSSLKYLPPKIYYRGKPERILQARKRKLEEARRKRIIANLQTQKAVGDSLLKIAFCPTFN